MSEKPILFSGEMVKAILEGLKTQTRRPINPQPIQAQDGKWDWYINDKWRGAVDPLTGTFNMTCPYGKPGDILWVRETWCYHTVGNWYGYKADGDYRDLDLRWKPSIHMPREAARLFLLVKTVRVERLQDISEVDAIAEGIKTIFKHEPHHDGSIGAAIKLRHISQFATLWDSIYAKRGYGWDINPWVWVIEFERMVANA